MVGSPPPWRAAMMMARLSLLHSLPRLASMAPFLCLIVAQCEWPDMISPSQMRFLLARSASDGRFGPSLAGLVLEMFQFLFDLPIAFIGTATAARFVQSDG